MKTINQSFFWKALRFVSPKFALDSQGQANDLTILMWFQCFAIFLLLISIYAQREWYFDLGRLILLKLG